MRSGASPLARVVAAYVSGWKRVWRAPAITVGVLLVTLFLTPPLVSAIGHGTFFGQILIEDMAGQNRAVGWTLELGTQVRSLAFTHEFVGFGALLVILQILGGSGAAPAEIVGALATYVAVWTFLTGGILDRLARDRPVRTAAFFAAGGGFFFRMLRLGILAGAAYWAIFRWLAPLLESWADLVSAESVPVAGRAALFVLFLVPVATVGTIVDVAKVRAVVEDRRSMVGALAASIRFIGRRAGRVVALWLLHLVVVAAIVGAGAWYLLNSYPTTRGWYALLLVQLYLVFRLWAKLGLMGAQIAFFQGELAHASYTAAPLPVWPDSPAAEAIDNFLDRRPSGGGADL